MQRCGRQIRCEKGARTEAHRHSRTGRLTCFRARRCSSSPVSPLLPSACSNSVEQSSHRNLRVPCRYKPHLCFRTNAVPEGSRQMADGVAKPYLLVMKSMRRRASMAEYVLEHFGHLYFITGSASSSSSFQDTQNRTNPIDPTACCKYATTVCVCVCVGGGGGGGGRCTYIELFPHKVYAQLHHLQCARVVDAAYCLCLGMQWLSSLSRPLGLQSLLMILWCRQSRSHISSTLLCLHLFAYTIATPSYKRKCPSALDRKQKGTWSVVMFRDRHVTEIPHALLPHSSSSETPGYRQRYTRGIKAIACLVHCSNTLLFK